MLMMLINGCRKDTQEIIEEIDKNKYKISISDAKNHFQEKYQSSEINPSLKDNTCEYDLKLAESLAEYPALYEDHLLIIPIKSKFLYEYKWIDIAAAFYKDEAEIIKSHLMFFALDSSNYIANGLRRSTSNFTGAIVHLISETEISKYGEGVFISSVKTQQPEDFSGTCWCGYIFCPGIGGGGNMGWQRFVHFVTTHLFSGNGNSNSSSEGIYSPSINISQLLAPNSGTSTGGGTSEESSLGGGAGTTANETIDASSSYGTGTYSIIQPINNYNLSSYFGEWQIHQIINASDQLNEILNLNITPQEYLEYVDLDCLEEVASLPEIGIVDAIYDIDCVRDNVNNLLFDETYA